VNGGEEDDDEPPACMDYVMHYITLPFKVIQMVLLTRAFSSHILDVILLIFLRFVSRLCHHRLTIMAGHVLQLLCFISA
jgi:hypothetical protein